MNSFQMNARSYNDKASLGPMTKVYPLVAKQIIERTGVTQGICIDLGGGPGMLRIALAEQSDLRVTVCDLLQECIDVAKENIAGRLLTKRMSARPGRAEELPFANNSIDLVASRGSIFFWEDHKKGLSEVMRVLKPKGWAYIGGGFGSAELLREVEEFNADNKEWKERRKERVQKFSPEYYQAILNDLGIKGSVDSGETGTWIVFQKQIY